MPDANNRVVGWRSVITVAVTKVTMRLAYVAERLKNGGCTVDTLPPRQGRGHRPSLQTRQPRAEVVVLTGSRKVRAASSRPPAEPSATIARLLELARFAAKR